VLSFLLGLASILAAELIYNGRSGDDFGKNCMSRRSNHFSPVAMQLPLAAFGKFR
jgi:hypothetical protein